jgi:hypothetical protein
MKTHQDIDAVAQGIINSTLAEAVSIKIGFILILIDCDEDGVQAGGIYTNFSDDNRTIEALESFRDEIEDRKPDRYMPLEPKQ